MNRARLEMIQNELFRVYSSFYEGLDVLVLENILRSDWKKKIRKKEEFRKEKS
jgi:hypothetical protein